MLRTVSFASGHLQSITLTLGVGDFAADFSAFSKLFYRNWINFRLQYSINYRLPNCIIVYIFHVRLKKRQSIEVLYAYLHIISNYVMWQAMILAQVNIKWRLQCIAMHHHRLCRIDFAENAIRLQQSFIHIYDSKSLASSETINGSINGRIICGTLFWWIFPQYKRLRCQISLLLELNGSTFNLTKRIFNAVVFRIRNALLWRRENVS